MISISKNEAEERGGRLGGVGWVWMMRRRGWSIGGGGGGGAVVGEG